MAAPATTLIKHGNAGGTGRGWRTAAQTVFRSFPFPAEPGLRVFGNPVSGDR
jgi:hypothetical protein